MGTFNVRVAAKTAEILIYDAIGLTLDRSTGEIYGISPERFLEELKALGKVERIVLRFNSEGGNLFDAITMHSALERHPARIEAEIDGLSASAASFLMLAADSIRIARNAWVMIHEGTAAVQGNKADFERTAALLGGANENLVSSYSERTGLPKNKLREMMAEETWMTAAVALQHGFVDEITANTEVMARISPDRFKHVPRELMNRIRASSDRPQLDARRSMAREHAQRAALHAVAA